MGKDSTEGTQVPAPDRSDGQSSSADAASCEHDMTSLPPAVELTTLRWQLLTLSSLLLMYVQKKNKGVRAWEEGHVSGVFAQLDTVNDSLEATAQKVGLAAGVVTGMLLPICDWASWSQAAGTYHNCKVAMAWENHALQNFHGRLRPGCGSLACKANWLHTAVSSQ